MEKKDARIRKGAGIAIAVAILASGLYISKSLHQLTLSAEEKITQAIPLSEKLRLTKTGVFETASSEQWGEIENELNARLKIRAVNCAKGYAPRFYTSIDTVRKNLMDMNCFSETDNDIAHWLAIRKVGLMLAKPGLRPLPADPPAFIVMDRIIQNASFASNAGIAMMETEQELQIVDVNTQKPLLREPKTGTLIGDLSANGRIFVTGDASRLKIRDAISGAVIVELSGIRPQHFHWMDESIALFNRNDSGKIYLIDFNTGKEIPVQTINRKILRVARLPQSANQFLAISPQSIVKIELIRTPKGGLEIKLLDEKHFAGMSDNPDASGITADGNYYFNAGRPFTVIALNTLTSQPTPSLPFSAQFAVATSDPDLILLSSARPSDTNEHPLLYSISKRTTTSLESHGITGHRCLYASAMKRQASIVNNKIALWEVQPASPLASAEKASADAPPSENPSR